MTCGVTLIRDPTRTSLGDATLKGINIVYGCSQFSVTIFMNGHLVVHGVLSHTWHFTFKLQ